MTTKVQFQLTDAEKASPMWARLKQRYNDRIEALHLELEHPDTTEAKTALIRGQFKALREQLALDKELPPGHPAAR